MYILEEHRTALLEDGGGNMILFNFLCILVSCPKEKFILLSHWHFLEHTWQ